MKILVAGADLQRLIFTLYVQAKAGIPGPKQKLDQIKLVLFPWKALLPPILPPAANLNPVLVQKAIDT